MAEGPAEKSPGTGLRVAALLLVLAPIPGMMILRHLMRGWSDTANMVLASVVLGPLAIISLVAAIRSRLHPRKAVATVRPRRDLLAWKMLNERWRQSLTSALLAIIVVLALLLWVAGMMLRGLSPAFDQWAARDSSTLGLLLIVAISTGATFLGAVLAGPKLIRFTTGRMPMGTAKRPR